jgi:hypothetical protein
MNRLGATGLTDRSALSEPEAARAFALGDVIKNIRAERFRAVGCLVVAVALAAASPSAAAKDMRYPEKGPVAFVLHLPDDWGAKLDDSGNMLISAPDHSGGLSLSVNHESANSLAMTGDQFANEAFDVAKAEHFNKKEPASISGVGAVAYYTRLVNPGGVSVLIKMILIKSAHDYVVAESILTIAKLSNTQQRALDGVLEGISLTGAQ